MSDAPETPEQPAQQPTDLALLKRDTSVFVIPAVEADPDNEVEPEPELRYHIQRFCFYKSLLILELLGRMADKADIGSIFEGRVVRFEALVEKLPVLITELRPVVVRALALTLAKNKDLERAEDEELSLDEVLKPYERVVRQRLDLEQAAQLLTLAIERIGIQQIKQHFPGLLAALKAS